MKVTISVKDEDIMALLVSNKDSDPILLPYGRLIADAVAEKLSIPTENLQPMRDSYLAAQEAVQTLNNSVSEAVEDYNSRHEVEGTLEIHEEMVDKTEEV